MAVAAAAIEGGEDVTAALLVESNAPLVKNAASATERASGEDMSDSAAWLMRATTTASVAKATQNNAPKAPTLELKSVDEDNHISSAVPAFPSPIENGGLSPAGDFSPSTTLGASASPSTQPSKSPSRNSTLGSPIPRLERQSSATLDAAMRELDGTGTGFALDGSVKAGGSGIRSRHGSAEPGRPAASRVDPGS